MTDDATFERDLRAMLAGRDPGPPPAGLAIELRARIATDPRTGRFTLVGRAAGAATVVAVMAAVIVLAIVVVRPISTGPGASPLPAPSAPYAIRAGDGVTTNAHVPLFQIVAGLAAVAALVRLLTTTTVRWKRIASVLGVLVVIIVAARIGTSDAIGFAGGWYVVQPGREAPQSAPGMYVAVTGDQPFALGFTITNTSRLAVEVRGMERADFFAFEAGRVLIPRFVGLGLLDEGAPDPARPEPFQPFVLQPGEQRDVAILGMAGACAIPSVGPEGQAGYSLETVKLVYEQLSIEHVAVVELPEPVVITTPGSCS